MIRWRIVRSELCEGPAFILQQNLTQQGVHLKSVLLNQRPNHHLVNVNQWHLCQVTIMIP